MKSAINLILTLSFGFALSAQAQDWIPIFNGKDSSGWSVQCVEQDRDKHFWSVTNGVIQVNSIGHNDHDYMWYMTDQEFSDFELKLKFRIVQKTKGNSGVQIRSRYDQAAGWLDGPQLDIHPASPMRAGLIFDETRGTQRWIFPDLEPKNHNIPKEQTNPNVKLLYGENDWNEMHVIAQGTKIKCYINGELATDYEGAGVLDDAAHKKYNVGLKGHIALQLHRKNSVHMQYKDIRVKEL